MKRFIRASTLPLIISGFTVLSWYLLKDVTIDVLQPTGGVAIEQRNLLYFTLMLSVIVVVPVFVLLSVFAYKYREGRGQTYEPEMHGSNLLEAIWWGIPIIIIFILAVVTWQTSNSLDPYKKIESHNPTIEVQVVALQWKWLFIYPEYNIASVNELPIPVDHPVHFTLAADAPMSSFWIPTLGSQIYSMNGMSSELNLIANKTGEFTGYNTNINGPGYAKMTFNTRVTSAEDFSKWTKEVAAHPNSLSFSNYEKLAEPSVIEEPQFYRLSDPSLYDKIIDKYMHGMSHGPSSSAPEGSSATQHHGGHH